MSGLEHLFQFVRQPAVLFVVAIIAALVVTYLSLLWVAWNDRGATR